MADELHDTYLQTLAAIDFRAEAARVSLSPPTADAQGELAEIKRIARQGAARAREFIQQQQAPLPHGPQVLADLVRARWEGRHELEIQQDVQLNEAQWNVLELLVKEGLNNARRHAKSKTVRLLLQQRAGEVVASLENDGTAADPHASFGYGLTRLQEAVRSQGGELSFVSGEGGNTTLCARFRIEAHDS